MNKFRIIVTLTIISTLFNCGCKKLVDVKVPDNVIVADNVYNSDVTAIAVLNGIYTQLSNTTYISSARVPNISIWAGLSADEFTLWSNSNNTAQIAYYKNALSATGSGGEFWLNTYPLIYACNAAIKGLEASTTLTPSVRKQLLGEAKFIRAFFYFYLVNLYGDVPLVLTTDYTVNTVIPRTPTTDVSRQIIADLQSAQEQLADGYMDADVVTSSAERLRPCRAAATALLARVYLYAKQWSNAEAQSTAIISNTSVYDTVPLNKVFLKNSKEAIWQLQPVSTGSIVNSAESYFFVLSFAPKGLSNQHPVYLSNALLSSFETNDQRNINGTWVNVYTDISGSYYYPYKYKDVTTGDGNSPTEYTMMLRLGEQYLIRAEARAQQNNISGAQSDLNVIRHRAGLSNTAASGQASLLAAILHERQVELFSEWGHRWLDLKRTGNIDAVMTIATPLKGGTWSSYKQFYPIQQNELLKNPRMTQTAGY
jgi:hypothetical protein